MADTAHLPPFRPLPMRAPDIEFTQVGEAMYLTPRQAPGARPRTIPHCLVERAAEHPDRPFLRQRLPGHGPWREISYGEAKEAVHALAQSFIDMGAGPDAPVMILSGNSIETALVMLAAQTAGAPAAPISVPYSLMSTDFAKLKHCFEAVKPAVIFVRELEPFKPALEALGAHGGTVVTADGAGGGVISYDELVSARPTETVAAAMDRLADGSIAKYLFTSGSTGMPKPVPTTEGALCAMLAGQEGLRDDARDPEHDADAVPQSLDWMPWNHISGSNVNFNGVLWNGGTLWIDEGKPTPALFGTTIKNLYEVSPQVFGSAPIALAMLAEAMEEDDRLRASVFKNLRYMAYGGATLSDDLYGRLQSLAIKATGRRIPITTMYGATETQGITVVHWEVERVGLVGLPLPGLTLKVVPNGAKLELRVKGPTVMPGYHNLPEKTAEAFDEEGFYKLGDAVKFVDPDDPNQGLIFDGRVGEDFKLSSGTWVSVGTLRPDLVAACSPLIFDAVICGQDKNYASAMVWPSPAAVEAYGRAAGGDLAQALGKLTTDIAEKIRAHNAAEKGSSRRIKRFTVLTTPPSIDAGEITDKGYVNQRAVQDARADTVARLYADPLDPGVVDL